MHLLSNRTTSMFPPVEHASPEGLLAIGGDLSSRRLLDAYRHGIFPWYSAGQPILWWSPDPRAVLYPQRLRVSRSLRKTLKRGAFTVTFDRAFESVIDACAEPRLIGGEPSAGTWITSEMRDAYVALHQQGYAHSVETWLDGRLAGGLYGVALGRAFFGESMFHRETDASKVALAGLVELLQGWGFHFIDCQLTSAHIMRLGAVEIPRRRFLDELAEALDYQNPPADWRDAAVSGLAPIDRRN
ncbi:MAG TPA: leucyl/phenylalanyl-tRNA--protein transferase [Arenicellales bacterium]|nr:leucyl/phenylalanyl-tRNA--protein transferase [Arenicellales bacterium]